MMRRLIQLEFEVIMQPNGTGHDEGHDIPDLLTGNRSN